MIKRHLDELERRGDKLQLLSWNMLGALLVGLIPLVFILSIAWFGIATLYFIVVLVVLFALYGPLMLVVSWIRRELR